MNTCFFVFGVVVALCCVFLFFLMVFQIVAAVARFAVVALPVLQ